MLSTSDAPGNGLCRPPVFLFGTLCHKVKAQRISVGPQTEGAARHDFGTTCPEVAGFGEAPQQAFLRPPRGAKIASVYTLALLAIPCVPANWRKKRRRVFCLCILRFLAVFERLYGGFDYL